MLFEANIAGMVHCNAAGQPPPPLPAPCSLHLPSPCGAGCLQSESFNDWSKRHFDSDTVRHAALYPLFVEYRESLGEQGKWDAEAWVKEQHDNEKVRSYEHSRSVYWDEHVMQKIQEERRHE